MSPSTWLDLLIIASMNFVLFLYSPTLWLNVKLQNEYMKALGFEMDYIDEFHNEQYEVFDAVPNNVLYGIDGHLYFIDTQIRLRSQSY